MNDEYFTLATDYAHEVTQTIHDKMQSPKASVAVAGTVLINMLVASVVCGMSKPDVVELLKQIELDVFQGADQVIGSLHQTNTFN